MLTCSLLAQKDETTQNAFKMIEVKDRIGPKKNDSKEYFQITYLHPREDEKAIASCISAW